MSLSSNQQSGLGPRGGGQTPLPTSPTGTRSSGPLARTSQQTFQPLGGLSDEQPGEAFAWDANFSFPGTSTASQSGRSAARKQEEPRLQPAPAMRPPINRRARRNLFLDIPIAGRLALGFVIAALVAGLAAGIVGVERAQSLSKQTDFYHHLLQLNTSLTTGHSFLELMNSELNQTVQDASAANPSYETVDQDKGALNNLAKLYTQTLNGYVQQDLLDQHADQMELLNEANQSNLAQQQLTLTSSTQRTWQYYQNAQQQIIGYFSGSKITPAEVKNAQLVLKLQAQPTNADALSALHSLIQLDDRLASAVDDATNVEIQNELFTTLLATIGAFLLIALVGWFISDTLVRRLRHLHHVTRAVEEGKISERVLVAGRDEIAEVSLAVNAMVDTIVGLLEETRQQRDALTGAAEHLFSDMRIVNAGDLRINATVSNDPIGMLANAFNFTVGRFRRFLVRTQASVEQLDVVARQSQERSGAFVSMVRTQLRDLATPRPLEAQAPSTGPLSQSGSGLVARPSGSLHKEPSAAVQDALQLTQNDLNTRLAGTRETIDRASLALGRLNTLLAAPDGNSPGKAAQVQQQELTTLEQTLRRLSREVRQIQQNTTNNFTKLADAVASQPAQTRPFAQEPEIVDGTQSVSDAQYQEFVRQAGSFAVEVNALARRLSAIVQEMRSGIAPFHLESTGAGENLRISTNPLEAEPLIPPSSFPGGQRG